MWSNYGSLTSPEGRLAFVSTVREVIDMAGQRVSANDKLYLAAAIPTLIVWGDRDGIIPVAHGHAAHHAIPGSRLEILEGSGHFLPLQDRTAWPPWWPTSWPPPKPAGRTAWPSGPPCAKAGPDRSARTPGDPSSPR